MQILLATGIYPPEIGGPATYVQALARELTQLGNEVVVVTYGKAGSGERLAISNNTTNETTRYPLPANHSENVFYVSKRGGPLLRWLRYARALKVHGKNADVIECFSSVSCGVPLRFAGVRKPVRVLRLGGDFLWERYTDLGGGSGLRQWHRSWKKLLWPLRLLETWIYRAFDHVMFSSQFQEEITARSYRFFPPHSVIENSAPPSAGGTTAHVPHDPFRLLFLGRFVGFKNLPRLLLAVSKLPWVTLTLVGDGPMKRKLRQMMRTHGLESRVKFLSTVHGDQKNMVFADHDLLVIPSLTELTPHAAVEARAHGLPVLLTTETGLTQLHTDGMWLRPMRTSTEIMEAIQEVCANYERIAQEASAPLRERSWSAVAAEHLQLFRKLLDRDMMEMNKKNKRIAKTVESSSSSSSF